MRHHLLRLEQVPQVRAGVVGARVAVALGVQRAEVSAVLRPGQVVAPVAGVERAGAGHTGGGDAVEGVGAVLDGGEQVVGLGDAQQVARLVLGQLLRAPAHDGPEVLLLQGPADAIAVEAGGHAVELPRGRELGPHPREVAAGLAAQVLVLGPLDHAEQRLVRPRRADPGEAGVLVEAALGPSAGALERLLLVAAGVVQGGQLVEGEHDVRAEVVLDAHGHLGGEPVSVPGEVGLEPDAVVVDVGQALLAGGDGVVGALPLGRAGALHVDDLLEARAEAHHLEAARVREGRPGPVHERAEAAGLVQEVVTGLQVQVIRVGQQRLRAEVLHRLRQHRLDRGLRGHRDERRRLDPPVRRGDDARAAQRGAVVPGGLQAVGHLEAEVVRVRGNGGGLRGVGHGIQGSGGVQAGRRGGAAWSRTGCPCRESSEASTLDITGRASASSVQPDPRLRAGVSCVCVQGVQT